jgi:hypothetical protein
MVSLNTTNISQRCLQYLIEGFDCTIRLWVVWSSLLMMKFKFLSQGFNGFVDEVCALITHEDLHASKSGYNILKYELHSCSCTTVLNFSCFFPSGQILFRNDNVSSSCVHSRRVNRSHKVNGPFIEYL